jgi:opacity protein-like surface antigen
MRRLAYHIVFLFASSPAICQSWHIGVFGGAAAYNGDLSEKIFPKKVTNGTFGISVSYELSERITLRGGFNYAVVGGADRFSSDSARHIRNLSFETRLFEFHAVAEYCIFNLDEQRFSPYAFAGLAVFRFNPYAYDLNKQQVFLQPLSTEGQGISGYPNRKPYSLTQPAIPFGGGVKFAISENLRAGVEIGLRKLFTDYFDDVSTTYADQNDLLNAKGQQAVDFAFRSNQLNPFLTYPAKGTDRGNPKGKDWYYFAGIHLTYRLGEGHSSGGFSGGNRKNRTGCPPVPF